LNGDGDLVADEPGEHPHDENDGNGEDQRHGAGKQKEKSPVLTFVAARLTKMPLEQLVVAAVGLPYDIKDVAEEGDGADENADAQICGHAHDSDVGQAAHPCGKRNDERQQSRENIAEAGNESDDAVDTETEAGAGNAEGLVEQDFKAQEGAVAKDPRAAGPAVFGQDLAHGLRRLRGGETRRIGVGNGHWTNWRRGFGASGSMLQFKGYMAAIVQWQNA
jgi:hypothetical protein